MKRSLVPIALLLLLPGCATNPVTGEADFVLMSEQEEIARGIRYDEAVRPLTADERVHAEGRRVKIDIATPGLTFRSLAARVQDDPYTESRLRLMNDKYPSGEPAAGDRIKLIE